MKSLNRRALVAALAVLVGVTTSASALAQAASYPNRPIRIVVPFPVGGIADTFSRTIGIKLTEVWGQPVVVENKTGAGGNIGAELVAKSAPDGYTLVMGNIGSHAVNVSLFKNIPFDPIKDFVPIAHVLDAEGLLVVNPSVNANSVREILEMARAQPGKLSYASGGLGTTSHLAGELFKSTAKVDIVHVPYKGNSPAITDLLGGQTQMSFATMPTVLPHVKAGKLRAIASIGLARTVALPDVPTVAESGCRASKSATGSDCLRQSEHRPRSLRSSMPRCRRSCARPMCKSALKLKAHASFRRRQGSSPRFRRMSW